MLIVGAYILSNESEVNDQGSTRWWQAVHARTGQKVRIRKIPKEEFHQDTDMKQILPRYALCFKEKLEYNGHVYLVHAVRGMTLLSYLEEECASVFVSKGYIVSLQDMTALVTLLGDALNEVLLLLQDMDNLVLDIHPQNIFVNSERTEETEAAFDLTSAAPNILLCPPIIARVATSSTVSTSVPPSYSPERPLLGSAALQTSLSQHLQHLMTHIGRVEEGSAEGAERDEEGRRENVVTAAAALNILKDKIYAVMGENFSITSTSSSTSDDIDREERPHSDFPLREECQNKSSCHNIRLESEKEQEEAVLEDSCVTGVNSTDIVIDTVADTLSDISGMHVSTDVMVPEKALSDTLSSTSSSIDGVVVTPSTPPAPSLKQEKEKTEEDRDHEGKEKLELEQDIKHGCTEGNEDDEFVLV